MKSLLRQLLRRVPPIAQIIQQRDDLLKSTAFVPPGHFLSPIVSVEDYLKDEAAKPSQQEVDLGGIDLRASQQLALLRELTQFPEPALSQTHPDAHRRFYAPNPAFCLSDAFLTQAMMRQFRPQRLIEVGSGYSSCAILDCNEHHFEGGIALTFIEPFPQLLKKLVREDDLGPHTVLPTRLQDVPVTVFEALEANDILFIDSTHVSKTNSDVNHLFFHILPKLAAGVVVHIHDIFFPFEYPRDWVLEGRSWNEAYILRAFLQYNEHVEILLFSDYLTKHHSQAFQECLPEYYPNSGGSIWLVVK
jgi:hypothetical protein